MALRRTKINTRDEMTCMVCHNSMKEEAAYRSLTWFGRIIGARALLCSVECRDEYDATNPAEVEAE